MRFRAMIDVPEHATVGELRDVEEMLRGHGFAQLKVREGQFGRFEFEFEPVEDPGVLTKLLMEVAVEEARRLGVEAAEPTLRLIFGRALSTAETWHEVVEELRAKGWHVPHESVVRVPG